MSPTEFEIWMRESQPNGKEFGYGHCPHCDAACQPDCIDNEDCDEEWVECEDCGIEWILYYDDPDDPRNETEPWREYRIGEVRLVELGY